MKRALDDCVESADGFDDSADRDRVAGADRDRRVRGRGDDRDRVAGGFIPWMQDGPVREQIKSLRWSFEYLRDRVDKIEETLEGLF